MTTRSLICSTSFRMWLETITIRSRAASSATSAIVSTRAIGSSPFSGSSSSTTSGSWAMAWASFARWRIPWEYVPRGRYRASPRPT